MLQRDTVAGDLHNGRLRLAYLTGEESRLSVSLDCGGEARGPRDLLARNNTGTGAAICRHPPRPSPDPSCSTTRGSALFGIFQWEEKPPPACQTQADSFWGLQGGQRGAVATAAGPRCWPWHLAITATGSFIKMHPSYPVFDKRRQHNGSKLRIISRFS